MQVTDFPFEICIGDDLSDDGTAEICSMYSNESELIRLTNRKNEIQNNHNKKNVNGSSNFIETINFCRGKYIALCEGDDYWIDKYKLQKQIEVLKLNPEYSGCVTRGVIMKNSKKIDETLKNFDRSIVSFSTTDLLNGNPFLTCSSVYKKELVKKYTNMGENIIAGDYGLHIFASYNGEIGFVNEITSAYRLHKKGIWSGLSERKRLNASAKRAMIIKKRILTKVKHKQIFSQYILNLNKRLLNECIKEKNIYIMLLVFLE